MTYRQPSPEERYMLAALRRQGLNQSAIDRRTATSAYRHVWRDKRQGGTLHTNLRGARKRRHERYGAYDGRGLLAGRRLISGRPPEVEARSDVGQWEAETVMGAATKDCVVTLVDRRTGLVLIGKLAGRTAESLTRLIRTAGRVETVTADNGTEFHGCERVERLGQYLPKGVSMAGLTQRQCNAVARRLNTRPRKRLGLGAPLECFNGSWSVLHFKVEIRLRSSELCTAMSGEQLL